MKVFKIISYIFFVLVALIVLLLAVSVLPITGNIKFLIVQSGSMEPTIKTGSVVLVKPKDTYNLGDIITFGTISKTQAPTTHRIIEIKDNKYITKGDANNGPDLREIKKTEVIGKMIVSIPYIGYAVSAAKRPIGFFLIIIIPVLLIVYDEVNKIRKEMKKMKNEK